MQQQLHRHVITCCSCPDIQCSTYLPSDHCSAVVVSEPSRIRFQSRGKTWGHSLKKIGDRCLTMGRLVRVHLQLRSALLRVRLPGLGHWIIIIIITYFIVTLVCNIPQTTRHSNTMRTENKIYDYKSLRRRRSHGTKLPVVGGRL